MGRVGQALDAVEVGDVVVVGLGEIGAEVRIALPQMTSVGAEIGRSFAAASFCDCRTEARPLPRAARSRAASRTRTPEAVQQNDQRPVTCLDVRQTAKGG